MFSAMTNINLTMRHLLPQNTIKVPDLNDTLNPNFPYVCYNLIMWQCYYHSFVYTSTFRRPNFCVICNTSKYTQLQWKTSAVKERIFSFSERSILYLFMILLLLHLNRYNTNELNEQFDELIPFQVFFLVWIKQKSSDVIIVVY